jgi:hypothetical protein
MLRCRLRSGLDVALLRLRPSLDGRLASGPLAVPGINLIFSESCLFNWIMFFSKLKKVSAQAL